MISLKKKYEKLQQFIKTKGKDGVIIAFSGGIDSSTLAAVCISLLGEKAIAVTAESPLRTSEELNEAKRVAAEIGIQLFTEKTNELLNEDFCKNPENRCYFCKRELLKQLQAVANKHGIKTVFEGTNFSDLTGHRPGYLAVQELENVYSPWAENKFTKEEIREIAKNLGLSVSEKPANACLASRIAYNEQITAEKLEKVAKAEKTIKKLTGVTQLRVRYHNGLARIEVPKNEIDNLCDDKTMTLIVKELKKFGFNYVTLDLEGYRTGSMLQKLDK